jgi:HSP20 family protein
MADKEIEVKPASAPLARGAETWRGFRDELDRVFDRFNQSLPLPFFGGFGAAAAPKLPSVDIAEDDKAYTVTAELPGMTAEDVDVAVKDGCLVLKGEKSSEHKTDDKTFHLSECTYGAFERSFYLPEGVDQETITASVAKGVLTVTLPKTAPVPEQTKKIEVKGS